MFFRKRKEKFLFSFPKEQCYKLVTSLVGTSIFCALILKCQGIFKSSKEMPFSYTNYIAMLHNLIILMILFEHIVKGKNHFMSHLLCYPKCRKTRNFMAQWQNKLGQGDLTISNGQISIQTNQRLEDSCIRFLWLHEIAKLLPTTFNE